MDLFNQLMGGIRRLAISIRKPNTSLFLFFLALSTIFWPILEPFQNIARWVLLFTSSLIWYGVQAMDYEQTWITIQRYVIVIGMTISYSLKLALSQINPILFIIYYFALYLVTLLWFVPISPMRFTIKEKNIKISDWFIVAFTAIYIVSFELLNYYIP